MNRNGYLYCSVYHLGGKKSILQRIVVPIKKQIHVK